MIKATTSYLYSDIHKDSGLQNTEIVTGISEAMQRYILVLSTPKRSRWKRPFFGCNLQNLLFEPFDQETADNIKSEIVDCTQDAENDIADIKPTVEVVMDWDNTQYFVNLTIKVANRGTTSTTFNLRKL